MLDLWRDWIAAFDRACDTDDWSSLDRFVTDDVAYVVSGVPFACDLRGREAVLGGLRKSVRGFDRRFDRRGWRGIGVKAWPPNAVTCRAYGTYERAGTPTLTFSARAHWFFRDGRIGLMADIYDTTEADVAEALDWLARYGQDLDPSYV